jgi:hypothetical protein
MTTIALCPVEFTMGLFFENSQRQRALEIVELSIDMNTVYALYSDTEERYVPSTQ